MSRRDEEVVLGDAHRDTGDVTLLKSVGANIGRRHLTSDHNEWRGVHVGVRDRGHDVRGTWSAGHHGDTGTARSHGVTLGHVTGTLLVAHEDVANG